MTQCFVFPSRERKCRKRDEIIKIDYSFVGTWRISGSVMVEAIQMNSYCSRSSHFFRCKKIPIKLKDGSSCLLLQNKHIGTQQAYYDLFRSCEFLSAPVISTKNWISIAHWLSLAMENAEILKLSAASLWSEVEPAQKAVYWSMQEARKRNHSAFS